MDDQELKYALKVIIDLFEGVTPDKVIMLKGEKGDRGERGLDGVDGSPDTPKQVKEKLLKAGISIKDIKGLASKLEEVSSIKDIVDEKEKSILKIINELGVFLSDEIDEKVSEVRKEVSSVKRRTVSLKKKIDEVKEEVKQNITIISNQAKSDGSVTDHGDLTGLGDDDHPQYQLRSEKGQANGYAELDANGKIPASQAEHTHSNKSNLDTIDQDLGSGDDVEFKSVKTLVRLKRVDTTSEGGEIQFERASDALVAWLIDVYNNNLRIFNSQTNNPDGEMSVNIGGTLVHVYKSDKSQYFNVGRGTVIIEDNSNDNVDGAGITLRTTVNPSQGSMFAVRSSGHAPRLWVGQSITSTGANALYVGTDNDGKSGAKAKIYSNGNAVFDGQVIMKLPVAVKTANYSILASESNKLFHNSGATGEVTLTLPTLADGLTYEFFVKTAQTMTISAGTDIIRSGSDTSNSLASNTVGDILTLVAVDGEWVATNITGNWT